jgi:hypothetical protein
MQVVSSLHVTMQMHSYKLQPLLHVPCWKYLIIVEKYMQISDKHTLKYKEMLKNNAGNFYCTCIRGEIFSVPMKRILSVLELTRIINLSEQLLGIFEVELLQNW